MSLFNIPTLLLLANMTHSNHPTIKTQLLDKIAKQGSLSFHEFMQTALYDPYLGFYTSAAPPLGEDGHFTTAPEISPLFAQCIASQIYPYIQSKHLNHVIEFGGGSGKLALELLLALEKYDALPDSYYLLDLSPSLKKTQQNTIKTRAPHLYERCHWLETLPTEPLNAIVIANEVLDAMPVNRFKIDAGTPKEIYIDNHHGELIEVLKPPSEPILKRLATLAPLAEGYQSEINLYVKPWLQALFDILDDGLVFLFDYGFPEGEYYHPDRHQGTLMCHHLHKAHANPYLNIGEQDITAHVDFTFVAESADDIGFDVKGYTHQASFLLANGITRWIDDSSETNRFKDNQAIKTLTLPHEMGELFKVIALGKNINTPLNDFALIDLRRQL